jgi:hypothetical protein
MEKNVFCIKPPGKNWPDLWRLRESIESSRRVEGAASLEVFKRRAKTPRISKRDREMIACALHFEITRLEEHPELCNGPFSRAALALQAGLAADDTNPTKRLRELTLDPQLPKDKLAIRKNSLCASYRPYISLIENGLTRFSKEGIEGICARVFSGTSYAGIETDIRKNRMLTHQLANIAAKVNSIVRTILDKSLEDCFRESAILKKSAQTSGSVSNWPFIDLWEPYAENGEEVPNWESPYWTGSRTNPIQDFRFGDIYYRAILQTSLDWHNTVVCLPRVYLGCAIHLPSWLGDWQGAPHRSEYLAAIDNCTRAIAEQRSLEEQRTKVVFIGDEGQTYQTAPSSVNNLMEGEGHCWIVIYPSPNEKGLVPMFYWSQGEGGVHVCVLTDETIDVLANFHIASSADARVISVFERIAELLKDKARPIEIEWARTAFDILSNPFLSKSKSD